MLSQRLANLVFVVLVVAACACFAYVAQGFETSGLLASSGLPSKFFPQLALGITALCAVVVGYLYWVRGAAGGDAGATVFTSTGDARRALSVLVVAIASFLVWRELGFVWMAVVMGPLSLLAMGVRAIRIYLAVWAMTALVYVVFTGALGVQLP